MDKEKFTAIFDGLSEDARMYLGYLTDEMDEDMTAWMDRVILQAATDDGAYGYDGDGDTGCQYCGIHADDAVDFDGSQRYEIVCMSLDELIQYTIVPTGTTQLKRKYFRPVNNTFFERMAERGLSQPYFFELWNKGLVDDGDMVIVDI